MNVPTVPRKTSAYRLTAFTKDLGGLSVDEDVQLPRVEALGPMQVIVEIHAVSLNARDYQSKYSRIHRSCRKRY